MFQGRRRVLYPHLSGASGPYLPCLIYLPPVFREQLRGVTDADIQRWIYRVDYSRVNEYGQVNEGMVEPVGEADKADGEKVEKIESKKTK